MLRFELASSRAIVSIDPKTVASVTETFQVFYGKDWMPDSGSCGVLSRGVARITLMNGQVFTVLDPNRIVARQIDDGKKGLGLS